MKYFVDWKSQFIGAEYQKGSILFPGAEFLKT
jgi:hypothetical protein